VTRIRTSWLESGQVLGRFAGCPIFRAPFGGWSAKACAPSFAFFAKGGLRRHRQTNSITTRRPINAAARCKLDNVMSRFGCKRQRKYTIDKSAGRVLRENVILRCF